MPEFSKEGKQMNKSESKYFHTAERMDEALLSLLLERILRISQSRMSALVPV